MLKLQLTITHYNSLYCTRAKAKATVYHTLVFSEARYRQGHRDGVTAAEEDLLVGQV